MKVKYFAWVRERVGKAEETIEPPASVRTVDDLIGWLAKRGETYAHAGTAVIAAGENPANPRYEVVVFAGLGAEATWHCVDHVGGRKSEGHAEILLITEGARPHAMVARGPGKPPVADASRPTR